MLLNPILTLALVFYFGHSQLRSLKDRSSDFKITLGPYTWLFTAIMMPMILVLGWQLIKGPVLANWSAPLFIPLLIMIAGFMSSWRGNLALWTQSLSVIGGGMIVGIGLLMIALSHGQTPCLRF